MIIVAMLAMITKYQSKTSSQVVLYTHDAWPHAAIAANINVVQKVEHVCHALRVEVKRSLHFLARSMRTK